MAVRTYGSNAVDWEQRIDLGRLREQRLAPAQGDAGALGSGRAAHLRLRQHPLHDRDPHRYVGDGQADPLRAAAPRRGADRVGLRLGGPAPPAVQPVAGRRGPCPGRDLHAARGVPPGRRDRRGGGPQGGPRAGRARPARRAGRGRPGGAAGAVRAPARRGRGGRRPAGVPGRPADQDRGRDRPADPRVRDGRRGLRGAVRVPPPGRARERVRRPGQQGALRPGQRVRRRGQRDLRRALLATPARLQRPPAAPGRPGVLRHPAQPPRLPHLLLPLLRVGSASAAQRDAYTRCRDYMDQAIALVKPGATTADIVSVWPAAREFGFPDEEAAFALQYGHGVGLSIWEKPIFSRLVSLEHPEPLEEGMVFALETYWPSADGFGAARIEKEVVVTADGCEVITKFPAEELLVAGRRYLTAGGALPTVRESQSHLNTEAGRDGRAAP